MARTCSIEGCDRPHNARGLCTTHYARWQRNGDPLLTQVIRGDDERRFWSKVDKTETCWNWKGPLFNGYGRFRAAGRNEPAHRYSYELLVEPIPDELVVDHLCRNTACVNPAHLEPVTDAVNILRGVGAAAVNARKTECAQGHPFTPENTYVGRDGGRRCRICWRAARKRWTAENPERRRAIERRSRERRRA